MRSAALSMVLLALPTLLHGETFDIKTSKHQVMSGGKAIKLEAFAPTKRGKYPAILLVPESASLKQVGSIYRAIARMVSREGYVVIMVHFFDRTGDDGVDPKRIDRKAFLAWMGAVRDSVDYARKLPNVQTKKIGLLGFSLGAYLSMSVAREEGLEIGAVAEFFGGLTTEHWKDLKRLPPTLIVHGARDKMVPVKEAHALRGFFESRKLPHQVQIYADQGHLFKDELKTYLAKKAIGALVNGNLGNFSTDDVIVEALERSKIIRGAIRLGVEFFERHLKPKR